MELTLYHGTNVFFDAFEDEYMETKESLCQYGVGFYFYGEKTHSRTSHHGNLKFVVKAEVKKPIIYEKSGKVKISRLNVERLILASPDLDGCLSNYGDLDFEGFSKLVKMAVNSYYGMDVVNMLNNIGNDFFPDDSPSMLKKFTELTGGDSIHVTKLDIWVIFNKKNIQIINMEDGDEKRHCKNKRMFNIHSNHKGRID